MTRVELLAEIAEAAARYDALPLSERPSLRPEDLNPPVRRPLWSQQ